MLAGADETVPSFVRVDEGYLVISNDCIFVAVKKTRRTFGGNPRALQNETIYETKLAKPSPKVILLLPGSTSAVTGSLSPVNMVFAKGQWCQATLVSYREKLDVLPYTGHWRR